jgi:SPP1 family phage portal protein
MNIVKTDKEVLTPEDILKFIDEHEKTNVPLFKRLWDYYEGEDTTILSRKSPDPNTPNTNLPIPYGRKIITTYTGYAYRPKYISYKPKIDKKTMNKETEEGVPDYSSTKETLFCDELQKIFDDNNEAIKTSRNGRNTGIYGVAYDMLYIDGVLTNDNNIPIRAEIKFFNVDPKELILIYDYSTEPKKKFAIRYFKINPKLYKVEVYDKVNVKLYDRYQPENDTKWILLAKGDNRNWFDDVPVAPYYFGDGMEGLIKPVIPLIDALDLLYSDSMNEFTRYAYAYLVMKGTGLTDPTKKKEPGVISKTLQMLKQLRLFEHLPIDATIEFLTKDIPVAFIEFMSGKIREQIHIQSHVPDFTNEKMSGASGIAIQRLLFDFENVVSSAEADFDIGLKERIRLIAVVLAKLNRATGDQSMITIDHKRNVPLNAQEFAQTALTMKQAGFSSYLVTDNMPDDIVPNTDEELQRQKEEQEALMPDVTSYDNEPEPVEEEKLVEEEV